MEWDGKISPAELSGFIGKAPYNPIYLYGSAVRLREALDFVLCRSLRYSDGDIRRCDAANFVSAIIKGFRRGAGTEVCHSFRGSEALVFENIEMLGGKYASQEIFYGLFDHYYERKKQIIITSSLPPTELRGFEGRVRTQLESGLIFCVGE